MSIISKIGRILGIALLDVSQVLSRESKPVDFFGEAPHLHIKSLKQRPLKGRRKDPKVKGIRRRAR